MVTPETSSNPIGSCSFTFAIAIFPGHWAWDLPGSPLESSQHRTTPSCQDLNGTSAVDSKSVWILPGDFTYHLKIYVLWGGTPETRRRFGGSGFLQHVLKITPDAMVQGPGPCVKPSALPGWSSKGIEEHAGDSLPNQYPLV